jgi:predicted nuclease of predicted toxin-antitoxin system
MRFLVDMNVSPAVAEWLRTRGHDAIHVRDAGMGRISDGELFRKATDDQRVVLTLDVGFGELSALWAGQPAGVVLLRMRSAQTPQILRRLSSVLAAVEPALEEGAFVVIEDFRVRVRHSRR